MVGTFNWRGQELTELWIDKLNDKERKYIDLAIDPNVKVTFKVAWYLIWPQSHMDYPDHFDQIVAQSKVK